MAAYLVLLLFFVSEPVAPLILLASGPFYRAPVSPLFYSICLLGENLDEFKLIFITKLKFSQGFFCFFLPFHTLPLRARLHEPSNAPSPPRCSLTRGPFLFPATQTLISMGLFVRLLRQSTFSRQAGLPGRGSLCAPSLTRKENPPPGRCLFEVVRLLEALTTRFAACGSVPLGQAR